MPKFSLSNLPYQINNTFNAGMRKNMFCIIMYCCDDELVMLKSKKICSVHISL